VQDGDLMLARLRQEEGFTLPEMLITIVIGMIITLAGFTLVEVVMQRSGEISARIEAVQNGRSAMDTITRQLRSQVCLLRPGGTVDDPRRSLVEAKPDSLTFYVDMRNTAKPDPNATPTPTPSGFQGPEKHTLVYDAAKRRILETAYKPTGVTNGVYSFQSTGTTRTVLYNADQVPAKDVDGNVVTDAGGSVVYVPVFQYYRYDFNLETPQPTYALTGTLTDTQLKQVARISINYKAQPARRRPNDRASTVFTNDVFVRTVDPNGDASKLSNPCI
jgi:prepilin-type N-terminal cleavage/methylation domain-containing protein